MGSPGEGRARPSRGAAGAVLAGLLAGLLAGIPAVAPAGAAAAPALAPGDPVENRFLPDRAGGRAPLLAGGRVTVFLFFRPGHDLSLRTLPLLARLQREFASRRVRFVALAPAGADRAAVEAAARQAGPSLPVLLDEGDALAADLGVAFHPAVGVADARGRLSGFQPWVSVHFRDSLRARIRHALGDIDALELTAELDPDPSGGSGPRAEARARVEFARMLRAAGRCERARLEMDLAARLVPPDEGEAAPPCPAR
jgi:hypothetical protein